MTWSFVRHHKYSVLLAFKKIEIIGKGHEMSMEGVAEDEQAGLPNT